MNYFLAVDWELDSTMSVVSRFPESIVIKK